MVCFDRLGKTGNIFWILTQASHELKKLERKDEAREMIVRVMDSGSYSEALRIISEYVVLTEVCHG